jgi:hypothetical protein
MKLDAKLLRYLSSDDFKVLTAVCCIVCIACIATPPPCLYAGINVMECCLPIPVDFGRDVH